MDAMRINAGGAVPPHEVGGVAVPPHAVGGQGGLSQQVPLAKWSVGRKPPLPPHFMGGNSTASVSTESRQTREGAP